MPPHNYCREVVVVRAGRGRGALLGVVEVACYTGLYLAGILGYRGSMVVEALLGLSALKLRNLDFNFVHFPH